VLIAAAMKVIVLRNVLLYIWVDGYVRTEMQDAIYHISGDHLRILLIKKINTN